MRCSPLSSKTHTERSTTSAEEWAVWLERRGAEKEDKIRREGRRERERGRERKDK